MNMKVVDDAHDGEAILKDAKDAAEREERRAGEAVVEVLGQATVARGRRRWTLRPAGC